MIHLKTIDHLTGTLWNKNTLETCKNPRPVSVSASKVMHNISYGFPRSAFFITSTKNAWLKLSCNFGESKWNPYWVVVLASSSGTNHVLNKHEDVLAIWTICDTTQATDVLQLFCKFGQSKWNLYWVIMLASSPGTNHVPNMHEDFDQCDPNAIPSDIAGKGILKVW